MFRAVPRGAMLTGDRRYFEYHCFESLSSCDSELWLRSHQQVLVLQVVEDGGGDTPAERAENGEPRVYKIRWPDGFEGDAFEDELLDGPHLFERPDPPAMEV